MCLRSARDCVFRKGVRSSGSYTNATSSQCHKSLDGASSTIYSTGSRVAYPSDSCPGFGLLDFPRARRRHSRAMITVTLGTSPCIVDHDRFCCMDCPVLKEATLARTLFFANSQLSLCFPSATSTLLTSSSPTLASFVGNEWYTASSVNKYSLTKANTGSGNSSSNLTNKRCSDARRMEPCYCARKSCSPRSKMTCNSITCSCTEMLLERHVRR